ncbi:MAG TPA: 2TM domain-containing protein [Streptosporangiaceae bacterium]
MPDLMHDAPAARHPDTASHEDPARQQAIRQIERRRRYRISAAVSGLGMLLLVLIWALSEYHNAGGWPVHGFSQSPGLHDVWNLWIIYPLGAWLVMLAAGGWDVYLRKPISEQQIRREIERQAGTGK